MKVIIKEVVEKEVELTLPIYKRTSNGVIKIESENEILFVDNIFPEHDTNLFFGLPSFGRAGFSIEYILAMPDATEEDWYKALELFNKYMYTVACSRQTA